MKLWNNTKGAVSIFLVIILVPMMTVSSLFVDASKIKLARGVAESAGDLTLNTALTDYDTKLKDLYGLFATAQDTTELYEKLEDYYRTCITSSGVSDEDAEGYVDMIMSQLGLVASNDDTADILNMELVDFDVSKKSDATLANATILEKQIVDFMKYRSPINTGLSFISSLKSFSTLSKQTELVDKRQEYYEAQETVMENAQEAWKYIYKYNQSAFITNDTNQYFTDMENYFSVCSSDYYDLAKTIIKDKYDAQNYASFNAKCYYIQNESLEVNGATEQVAVFYTNSDKTAKRTNYSELTTYSNTKKSSAENMKTALTNYYNASKAYEVAANKLLPFNDNTYGTQYLVQTNRQSIYDNWVNSAVKLYDCYNAMKHCATFKESDDVMTTSEKAFGSSSAKSYGQYYNEFSNDFDLKMADFDQNIGTYNSKLSKYKNTADVDLTTVNNKIDWLYTEVTTYRTTISDAKTNLEAAVKYLGYVYDGVKDGGTLDQKEGEWKNTANSSELKNTSMSKQDLAEIDSLSTYLNPTDVQKLIDRLNNIVSNLDKMLTEIDSYTFFGTKIVEIDSYETFKYILEQNIGVDTLKHVSTDTTQLENQVNGWCDSKFVIGQKIDSSWKNQSGTQAKLSGSGTDKLNFYSYLYQHFNSASQAASSTDEMKEDNENGKNLYDNLKSKSSSAASGETKKTEEASIETENELCNLSNRPSLNSGNDAQTASAEVKTGDSAAKDTSSSLSSMFSSLSSAALEMGTDLRDKLYVADYILGMFSYDTIEKEYKVNNPGKDIDLKTLTLNSLNAENNFAYGKEVEYIIYGGTNSSNIIKAYGSIYGIRFGFNVIYAFMDSSIRDTAFAVATPISAATLGVVPVPLIQAAIIIGIACCESAIDLADIREGKSVPLFKTQETWHCSVKGLINEAKGIAGSALQNAANYVIDEGTKKLGEVLDMTDDELSKYIDGGADELTGYIGDAYDTLITRHANTAIQKLTTLANNALEEYALDPSIDMVSYVSKGLDEWLANEAKGVDTSSDLGYIVKSEAVNIIKTQFVGQIIETLKQSKESISSEIESVGATITDKISDIRSQILDKVRTGCDKVKDYKSQMIAKLKDSMNQGAQSVKDTLNEQMNGIFGDSSNSTSDETGIASLLSFSYSDYMRLFLMIGLYTNEEGILLRTADVIQANMAKQTDNNTYSLSNSAVYVQISATIQVKPTLLALPLFASVENNPTSNTKWYTINYKSIKGY